MKISKRTATKLLGLWTYDFEECRHAIELTIKICLDYPEPRPAFLGEKIEALTALLARLEMAAPYAPLYDDLIDVDEIT